jgi:hypothetical protein
MEEQDRDLDGTGMDGRTPVSPAARLPQGEFDWEGYRELESNFRSWR